MGTVEQKLITQASVTPHWLPDGNSFWYLRHKPEEKSEFMFVDVLNKTCKRAFDHEGLVKELERQTSAKTDPESLPFSRIEIDPDASSISFRFASKKWRFGPEGLLQQIESDQDADDRVLQDKVPSRRTSKPVSVKFVNQSSSSVHLYWIDWNEKAHFYTEIEVGATKKQGTYEGHVWRIVDEASGATKTIYSAPSQASDVFVIEDQEKVVIQKDPELPSYKEKDDKVDDNVQDKTTLPDEANDAQIEEPEAAADKQDEQRETFVSDHNLWLKETDGSKRQLSSNGCEENKYDQDKIYPSQDGQFVVAWQYVPEQEHTINLVDSSPKDQLEPKLVSLQYLKPGDRVRKDRLRLFDLEKKCEVEVDDALFADPYRFKNIGWNKNDEEYFFLFNERGHKHVRVVAIRRDGSVRVVVEEKSDTFIDYSSKLYWHVLEETDEMIWASERDGYNHLYLIDLRNGDVKTQITKGNWNVRSVEHVDEDRRRLMLKVLGAVGNQDPYYAYPASVNLDGTGFRVLAAADGTHSWTWSPDKRYLIDTWSRVDFPPQTHLIDAESAESIMLLEESKPQELDNEAWSAPERFIAPGRDGKTPIYGIIIRPANFDESCSYPIIEDIYAGPQDFFTPKAFSALRKQRKWARQGYVIVKLDGMGTNWRSKQFHDVCYKNLKDGGLPDRIAWIKAAASTRPWMDVSRVGIFGGSAGGQNAGAAILHHGDFYKVAAADCGCHDNRMDKLWWNEQWMGYPVDESYAESSNVTHAAKLNGALMLIVGELDTNVDPSSTMQFVRALNEAGKEYELLYVPGGEHAAGESEYGQRRQMDFFKRHLCP